MKKDNVREDGDDDVTVFVTILYNYNHAKTLLISVNYETSFD